MMPVEETSDGRGDEGNGPEGHHIHDSSGDEEEQIFVNAEDGLTLESLDEENARHSRLQMQILEGHFDGLSLEDLQELMTLDEDDFPTTLIVAGLSPEFFDDEPLKQRFIGLFQLYGEDAAFHFFRSFKRVRVAYSAAGSAIQARIKMHLSVLGDNTLKCYFGQPPVKQKGKDKEDGLLHPPTPDKQFLISPPASPPVDWEPRPESHPNINYDLISAIAKLTPGESHELHKPEVDTHPSIVVHIAADDEELDSRPRPKIIQTKRPEA